MKHFTNIDEMKKWLRQNREQASNLLNVEVWRDSDGSYAIGSGSEAGPDDGDGIYAGKVSDYVPR